MKIKTLKCSLKHMLRKNKIISQETEQNYQLQYLLLYTELADSRQVKFYLMVMYFHISDFLL